MFKSFFLPAALAVLMGTPLASAAQKPNILFILSDDLGWGDLGSYGNRERPTPNIDRLAMEGVRLTNFYVSSPVCSPSRVTFMTGRYPAELGIHHIFSEREREANQKRGIPDFLDPNLPMLPKLLKSAGYRTGHVGKWHLGKKIGVPDPTNYGFDFHRTFYTEWNTPKEDRSTYWAKATTEMVDHAIEFLQEGKGEPFYLQLWTLLPHAPLAPSKEQLEPYMHLTGGKNVPYVAPASIYMASLRDLDTQVGRLLNTLKEMGLDQNTIVVFSSDNGPEDIDVLNASYSGVGSAGPFRGHKRSLREGGIRVPFIARWPGHIPPNTVDDTTVLGSVDFLPTIAQLCGIKDLPADRNGEVAAAVFEGKPFQRKEPLMWEFRFGAAGRTIDKNVPGRVIRDGNWKLLTDGAFERFELYDIKADPSETDNVADRHPDVVQRLTKKLQTWAAKLPPNPKFPSPATVAYPWPAPLSEEDLKPAEPKVRGGGPE